MLQPTNNVSAFIQAIGKAYIYTALDPTIASSWELLGLTEGDVGVDEKFAFNDYKLPEWTGDAIHERLVDGQDLTVTIPLIWGNADLYDKLAPLGVKGGGRSKPEKVVPRATLIIPIAEVGDGLANDGTGWTGGSAPVHSILLHRSTFEPGQYAFKHGDGGKVLRQIMVRPMFDDNKPEGQKLYTIGDPFAQGITTYRF